MWKFTSSLTIRPHRKLKINQTFLYGTVHPFSDGDVWLFDCGEGSQIQIQKSSVHSGKVKKIFITHLHGDHLFGLPGFMCTLGLNDKSEDFELQVYGPLGLRRYIREALNISRSPLNYKYIVHELVPLDWQYPDELKNWKIAEDPDSHPHPQEIIGSHIHCKKGSWHLFKDSHAEVNAGALVHRIPSFGFTVRCRDIPGALNVEILKKKGLNPGPLYGQLKKGLPVKLENGETILPSDVIGPTKPGKIITILGDTKDSSGIVDIALNSDIVVHEATFEDKMLEKALEHGHSTPTMAVQFMKNVKAKNLILFHFSQRYRQNEEPSVNILLNEAQEAAKLLNCDCGIMLADDLKEIKISNKESLLCL